MGIEALIQRSMRHSNEPEPPEGSSPPPFGVGVPRVNVPREQSAGRSQRPTSFQCALGDTWPRSTIGDLEAAFDPDCALEPLEPHVGDQLARALLQRFGPESDALGELWTDLLAEGVPKEARAHFLMDGASLVAPVDDPDGTFTARGQLLRASVAEPVGCFAARLLQRVAAGIPTAVLTDPTLPHMAEGVVLALREAAEELNLPTQVEVLYGDGLDLVRAAAEWPDVAVDVAAPDAAVLPWTRSLLESRAELLRVHAEALEAEALERERAGWFGSGVVPKPMAPLWIRPAPRRELVVDADADPGEVARRIASAAFGPAVLGGYSTEALGRVRIHRRVFSAVSEELLAFFEEELPKDPQQEARFTPPFWITEGFGMDRGGQDALAAGRRLGLDEGGTLILERRARTTPKKGPGRRGRAIGLIFTNIESRMRLGSKDRFLGALALMRGEADA